jgi:RsiW-degrading membrane proteinase PrsW (M82 family)
LIGAASGAGYALFENLTIGAAADVWTFVTITRIGTAAIHILTAGIVGWGITSAFKEKKYLRLLSSFFASILLHGIWNGLNILTALVDYLPKGSIIGSFGFYLANFAPIALIILALGSFVGLYRANSWFQRAIITPSNEKSEV